VELRKHHFRATVEAADKSTAAGAILASLPDDGRTFVEAARFREVLLEGAPTTFTVNGMPVLELVHDSGSIQPRGWAEPAVAAMAPPAGVSAGVVRSYWCVGEELTPTSTSGEGDGRQAHAAMPTVQSPVAADQPSSRQLPQLHEQGRMQLRGRPVGLSPYQPCGGATVGLEALLVNAMKVARSRCADSNRTTRWAAEACA
jgi:hypothetical protein